MKPILKDGKNTVESMMGCGYDEHPKRCQETFKVFL